MNNIMNGMLNQMIQQNPEAYNRAQQMCAGKSPDEIKKIAMNIAQSQGRGVNEIKQMLSAFGINL